MKAVLPAAGFGTRFLPITKAVPKEMLPLGDRPIIQYVVEEAVGAGCDEILVVISQQKEIIRHYFEPSPELESRLEAAGKVAEVGRLRHLWNMARFSFVYQPEMRGLGDAVRCAQDFVAEEPFAVLLADTVMHGPSPLPAMVRLLKDRAISSVALETCPAEKVARYGIAGGREIGEKIFQLDAMVEKPSLAEAPVVLRQDGTTDHFAFAARYLFTPGIFRDLAHCPPGKGGEIQLTDAMRATLEREGFLGVAFEGQRLDIGNPKGLAEAMALVAGSGAGAR